LQPKLAVGLPHCYSIGRTAGLHCTDSGELEQAEWR